jgi:hypothetical protein
VPAVVEDVEVHRETIPGAAFGNRVTERQTLMQQTHFDNLAFRHEVQNREYSGIADIGGLQCHASLMQDLIMLCRMRVENLAAPHIPDRTW